ncbi:FAD-dependent oxidoreductase [Candidatus Woesearchaeota archaeon]|nr:FAD-dependent oxidoreductase [Candidatus Woesearchaeota archaeon]
MVIAFKSEVKEVRKLTDTTIFLSLTCPADFTFKAGQYVALTIVSATGSKPRLYSILNSPSDVGKLDLCIRLVENGYASEVFRNSKVGDTFMVKGPFGNMLFQDQEEEHWFIATGTGVVPFYSMLKEFLPRYPQKKFKLFFGLRNKKDIFFEEDFKDWKQKYSHFDYLITLTREEMWNGPKGRVQQHLGVDFQGKMFYICGSPELVNDTKALLEWKHVPKENIKVEKYW